MFRPTIIVSGLTAAGKTTHAKALAELLDVPFFSASALLRQLAINDPDMVAEWGDRWNPHVDSVRNVVDIDTEVDRQMTALVAAAPCGVFDAALLPWLSSDEAIINLWIESDEPSRIRKCYVSHLDNAGLSLDDARKVVQEKDAFTGRVLAGRHGAVLTADDRFDIVATNSDLIPDASVAAAAIGSAIFSPVILASVLYLIGHSIVEPTDTRLLRIRSRP